MIDYSKLEWEWREQITGRGDGVTRCFTGSCWPRPVRNLSVFVVPGGLLDALIPLDDREPVPARHVQCNESGGYYTIQFPDEAPPEGSLVWVRWQWPVPRLRGSLVQICREDGEYEWVTLEELSDALMRR